MTVKWRTLWQVFLSVCVGALGTLSLLTSGQPSLKFWIGAVSATALLVWSNQATDRQRIRELERQAASDRQLRDAMVGRLADLMDSARRTDPTYRAAEERRKRTDDMVREVRKTLS